MSSDDMLGKSALAEVAGPLKDFAGKLGGPSGQLWLAAFKRFLRKEDPWLRFPVWKTIDLGTGVHEQDDVSRTVRHSCFASADALNMLESAYFVPSPTGETG